jgi:hypothetical protein
LGVVGDKGLGVRARYWRYDDDASEAASLSDLFTTTFTTTVVKVVSAPGLPAGPFGFGAEFNANSLTASPASPVPPDNGGTLSVVTSNDLQVDVLDLEATQELRAGAWSLLVSGGARYGRIDQNYEASVHTAFTSVGGTLTTNALDSLRTANEFRGLGPTLAAEARRELVGGFSLYGSARGSLLFGDQKLSASRHLTVSEAFMGVPLASAPTSSNASTSEDKLLPISELEVGAEWAGDWAGGRWILQGGWVGQIFHGAGSATSQDGDLGFTGLSVLAGVQY